MKLVYLAHHQIQSGNPQEWVEVEALDLGDNLAVLEDSQAVEGDSQLQAVEGSQAGVEGSQ